MRWTVLSLIATTFIVVVQRLPVQGFADGAPRSSCNDLTPSHAPDEPQQTTNPYQILLLDDVVDYRCGETVRSQ